MNTQHRSIFMVCIFSLIVLVGIGSITKNHVYAQDIQSQLIEREQEKWNLFAQGQIEQASAYYADDFINIGLSPMGTLRQNKQDTFAMLSAAPAMPGEIILSDFLVNQVSQQAVLVSYRVSAPFGEEYASSLWVERDGEWLTVFYQGTPFVASEQAPLPRDTTIEIPFFGRYRTQRSSGGSDALLLNADGSYAVDSGATGEYGTTGKFTIDGDLITFTDDERTDVPECSGDQRSASYQYTFTGGSLVLTNVDDNCEGRLNYFADRVWEK